MCLLLVLTEILKKDLKFEHFSKLVGFFGPIFGPSQNFMEHFPIQNFDKKIESFMEIFYLI